MTTLVSGSTSRTRSATTPRSKGRLDVRDQELSIVIALDGDDGGAVLVDDD
jgi:hypothetical protein